MDHQGHYASSFGLYECLQQLQCCNISLHKYQLCSGATRKVSDHQSHMVWENDTYERWSENSGLLVTYMHVFNKTWVQTRCLFHWSLIRMEIHGFMMIVDGNAYLLACVCMCIIHLAKNSLTLAASRKVCKVSLLMKVKSQTGPS